MEKLLGARFEWPIIKPFFMLATKRKKRIRREEVELKKAEEEEVARFRQTDAEELTLRGEHE